MNAEAFAKGFGKCRLLTRLLGQNVEILDDYGCPKIRILSKRTVRGSALFTLSDTKQGFTVPRESKSVWRLGNAPFEVVNFVRVFYLCLLI